MEGDWHRQMSRKMHDDIKRVLDENMTKTQSAECKQYLIKWNNKLDVHNTWITKAKY
jgi:hypothetical protein